MSKLESGSEANVRTSKTQLSRRSFLAGAGLFGAGLAAAGIAGCAPSASGSSSGGSASGGSTTAASGSSTVESVNPLKAPTAQNTTVVRVVDPSEVKSTEDCDIVVAGSGSAGTYAAIRAAERGANVIWLEKTNMKGGTSTVTEGLLAVDTAEQVNTVGKTDTHEMFLGFMDWHEWGCSPDAVNSFMANSGPAIDWAIEHGAALVFVGDAAHPNYTCLDEQGAWINNGTGMLTPLWNYGETFDNLDFRLETPVVNLVYGDDGSVTGVYALNENNEIIQINAKAVILATGGWGKNPAMCEARMREPYDRVVFCGFEGQDGDGVNMALAAGAQAQAPSAIMYGLGLIEGTAWDSMMSIFLMWPAEWRIDPAETLPARNALPLVNQDGRRFYCESRDAEDEVPLRNIPIAEQPQVWVLCDQDHVDAYSGIDEFDYMSGIAKGNLQKDMDSSSSVVKADTLEDLAKAMGVDTETFVETMTAYNNCAAGDGSVDPFGVAPEDMSPLLKTPFYAAKVNANAYSSCGGVLTDYNNEALDQEGKVIEGLYVCGLDNASIYYNNYPYGVYSGSGQGCACTTGFAAANAACDKLGK